MSAKPQPTELKRRAGNPGKRPLPTDEPQAPAGRPRTPSWLDPIGTRAFLRLRQHLETLGIASEVDEMALALAADIFSQYRRKRDWKLAARLQSLLAEFGLTPSSRTKVKLPRKPSKSERFFGVVQGGRGRGRARRGS